VQDEFVFILEGAAILVHDDGEVELGPGMCAGFQAGGTAHYLVNRSAETVVFLEVGDRRPGDRAEYPDDDLRATASPQGWIFSRKSGEAY